MDNRQNKHRDKNIYFLHLSDLHISNEGTADNPRYSTALERLIRDIVSQLEMVMESPNSNLVILISGDIIDKAGYEKDCGTVKKFFCTLKKRLDAANVKDVIIVPGNHDKVTKDKNNEKYTEDNEDEAYVNFLEMAHEIRKVFNSELSTEDKWKAPYGVDMLQIDKADTLEIDRYDLCFLRIDTARNWFKTAPGDDFEYDENHPFSRLEAHADFKTLSVGKKQRDTLLDDYRDEYNALRNEYGKKHKDEMENYKEIDEVNLPKEIKNRKRAESRKRQERYLRKNKNPMDLVIAVTHHPLSWLHWLEEEHCMEYFMSEELLNTDILACGHVHAGEVTSYFKHDHSLLVLTTGVGTTASPDDVLKYSVYSVNIPNNSIDVIMRVATTHGNFEYDYKVYANKKASGDDKLRYPLKLQDSSVYVNVNALNPIETRSLFIDKELVVNQIPVVVKSVANFSSKVSQNYSPCEQSSKFRNFLNLLEAICESARKELNDCFTSRNAIKTAYFRYFNKPKSNYPLLYTAGKKDYEKYIKPTFAYLGSAIMVATKTRKPVIHSVNRRYYTIDEFWDDNLTLVPDFKGNIQRDTIADQEGNEILAKIPRLTFGIFMKYADLDDSSEIQKWDARSLYLLAYLGLEKIIEEIIFNHICEYGVDIDEFLEWVIEEHQSDDAEEELT